MANEARSYPSPPQATVLIPAYNSAGVLAGTLDALAAQTADPATFEILVVDDGSTDDTPTLLQSWQAAHPRPRLRWLRQPNAGPAAARNLGLQHARGEYVLFTDDDCVLEPAWVQTILDTFAAHPGCMGVEGLTYTRVDSVTPFVHLRVNPGGYYPTCNAAYRAALLRELGGFDQRSFPLPYGEDLDLACRVLEHGPIIFAPDARVFHPARPISFWARVRRVKHLRYELLLLLRWPGSAWRHARKPTKAALQETASVTTPGYVSSFNQFTTLALLSRFDLLRHNPRLYAQIVAMAIMQRLLALWLLPGALLYAWRHKRRPLLPPLPVYPPGEKETIMNNTSGGRATGV